MGTSFLIGVIGLAGMPPFGTGLGKSLIEEAGREVGRGWIAIPLIAGASMTAGAMLRVLGRVFLGLGRREAPGDEARETTSSPRETPWFMLAPVLLLLIAAAASGLVSPPVPRLVEAARRFMDTPGYQSIVLDANRADATDGIVSPDREHGGTSRRS